MGNASKPLLFEYFFTKRVLNLSFMTGKFWNQSEQLALGLVYNYFLSDFGAGWWKVVLEGHEDGQVKNCAIFVIFKISKLFYAYIITSLVILRINIGKIFIRKIF